MYCFNLERKYHLLMMMMMMMMVMTMMTILVKAMKMTMTLIQKIAMVTKMTVEWWKKKCEIWRVTETMKCFLPPSATTTWSPSFWSSPPTSFKRTWSCYCWQRWWSWSFIKQRKSMIWVFEIKPESGYQTFVGLRLCKMCKRKAKSWNWPQQKPHPC